MQNMAIIGGGPAGLSAALEGIKKGFDVTLYEKHEIGKNIHCAEGFFDTLNLLGEPEYGVKYKVENILFQLESQYLFECDESLPIWMLDKGVWLRSLREKAVKTGVKIIENSLVNTENFHKLIKQFNWVIDCSGSPSVTSKVLGFSNYYAAHSYIAVQYCIKGDFSDLYKNFKLGFEKHYKGYFWIFPKSGTEANIGLGLYNYDKRNLWSELDKLLVKESLDSCQIIKKTGGICPCRILNKLKYGNVLLAGNAAGLASPLHGGGIDTAVLSGQIAVESIANRNAKNYRKKLRSILFKKLNVDKKLCNIFMCLSYDRLERIIDMLYKEKINLGETGFFNGRLFNLKNFKFYRILFIKLFSHVKKRFHSFFRVK